MASSAMSRCLPEMFCCLMICLIGSTMLMLLLIGFVLYPLVIVIAVVIHAVGALKARDGIWWNPPMTPRFVS